MESSTGNDQWILLGLGAALVMASFCAFSFLFLTAFRKGKVSVASFGIPDLMAGTVFFTWLIAASVRSFSKPERSVSLQNLIDGGILYLIVVIGILGFLKLRKISLREAFGFVRVRIWIVPVWALGLLLAVFPLLGATGFLTKLFLGPEAEAQEIVKFFQQSVQEGDSRALWVTIAIGGLVAPLSEELMFRGYLYGLCKRYVGPIAGILFNSVVFAAMHGNLAALPSLCVLAIALTIAYEITGSLLVPVTMHAFFNLTMFTVMLNFHSPAR